jgi:hypothetical protein
MAIENHSAGITITGEHIQLFHLMRVQAGLALEINTGMKLSGGRSTMKLAKGLCLSTKNTKKGVLLDLVAFTHTRFPEQKPTQTVVRALADVKMSQKLRSQLSL